MSAWDFKSDDLTGPIIFGHNKRGKLSALQSELDWKLLDFCRVHQIVYKEINRTQDILDNIETGPVPKDPGDYNNLSFYRKMDFIIGKEDENEKIITFVDHMTIIGLWAIAEQFLGKIYKAHLSIKTPNSNIKTIYKWGDFLKEFRTHNIDLRSFADFADADECRTLNNAIKHEPSVNAKLLNYKYFVPFKGKDLESVPLEMQRYLNGVSNFLGTLIKEVNSDLSSL